MAGKAFSAVGLVLALTACGSNSSSGAGTAPATAKVDVVGGCPTNSPYKGDNLCLPAPTEAEGFQLHYGPSDYNNPDEVAKYINPPGKESNDCLFVKTPNTADRYYAGVDFQMRPGSHHLNADINTAAQPDGFGECQQNDMSPGALGGTQFPKFDNRANIAPENQGTASLIPASSQAVLNFHVINTTEEPVLREAWLNYYYIDQAKVTGLSGSLFLLGGLGYQILPGTHKTYQYACSPTEPTRLLWVSSHMHAHATRMSISKTSAGQTSKLFDSYSWEDPQIQYFDTLHTNTPSDPSTLTAGGDVSGEVVVNPGDKISWECEINNDSQTTLTFRNEVRTGEMCIVIGAVVNAQDPMKGGDFRCTLN